MSTRRSHMLSQRLQWSIQERTAMIWSVKFEVWWYEARHLECDTIFHSQIASSTSLQNIHCTTPYKTVLCNEVAQATRVGESVAGGLQFLGFKVDYTMCFIYCMEDRNNDLSSIITKGLTWMGIFQLKEVLRKNRLRKDKRFFKMCESYNNSFCYKHSKW